MLGLHEAITGQSDGHKQLLLPVSGQNSRPKPAVEGVSAMAHTCTSTCEQHLYYLIRRLGSFQSMLNYQIILLMASAHQPSCFSCLHTVGAAIQMICLLLMGELLTDHAMECQQSHRNTSGISLKGSSAD